ncbi:MAG: hypothetical protein HY079_14945 [Elusimicrobia bacterium]|nr:hypothetical protein [Elusimicrobiota bacterium]
MGRTVIVADERALVIEVVKEFCVGLTNTEPCRVSRISTVAVGRPVRPLMPPATIVRPSTMTAATCA